MLYKELEEKYNIEIIKVDEAYIKRVNMEIEAFINRSYCIGRQVILGNYSNLELKLISLYHEIGHMCSKTVEFKNKYEQEKDAWDVGIKMAEKEGIKFSDKAKKFAKQELKTYDKYN